MKKLIVILLVIFTLGIISSSLVDARNSGGGHGGGRGHSGGGGYRGGYGNYHWNGNHSHGRMIRYYGWYGGPYYFYSGDCGWLYRKAVRTGRPYWWRRYYLCLEY